MKVVQKQRAIITKTTLIGSILNCILGVVKLLAGYWGQSHALMADGLHSLSDLVTDFFVYIAARIGGPTADREHPYGHGRIETLATIILSLILFLVAIGIAYDAILFLSNGKQEIPTGMALMTILISILVKEWLFHYTAKKAKKIDSNLLMVHAWHHRSDVASSVVVLVGIIGAFLGYVFLDAVAAVVVAILIGKVAFSFGLTSIRELIDTAVSEEQSEAIKKVTLSVEGVKRVHQLKTRFMGGKILVDEHVIVSPHMTVSEGHFIAHRVRFALKKAFKNILSVVVQVGSETDDDIKLSEQCMPRTELLAVLSEYWRTLPSFESIQFIRLHYLKGKVSVEVFLPLSVLHDQTASELQIAYAKASSNLTYLNNIEVFFS